MSYGRLELEGVYSEILNSRIVFVHICVTSI
jgi:hypothetical protein